MKCPLCGYENLPGTEHCEQCGADLPSFDVPAEASTIQQRIMQDTAERLFPYRAVTVEVGDSIGKAVRAMQDNRYGCVMVTRQGKLTGIVTERDILNKVANVIGDLESVPVEAIMTPNPHAVRRHDTFAVTLNLMAMRRYRHVPVVDDDGAPIGFLSAKGICTYLCEHALDEN
jgi:CBS domain-containing protein